jgi:integrase
MNRVYKVGMTHERVSKNPVEKVEICTKSDCKAIVMTPTQTLATLLSLGNFPHRVSVLTCAATALRASEILALRGRDILWDKGCISVSKRWAKGEDEDAKTEGSNAPVPMHDILAQALRIWFGKPPYHRPHDFVFPSLRCFGQVPLSESVFVEDHLRPAAIAAGVEIPDGLRFGLHNLRHSLSNWLVNAAKE